MKNARELWFSLARHIKHFERNVPPHPASPAQRQQVLQQRQQLKMAESAHAYVRGNTVRFYEWLRSDAVKAALPAGPDIWICGDCHTGNLGPVANITGEIEIQIRDLDQTVIGNPAHDLLRLGLSLAMAARGSDLPGVTTALMIEDMLAGYLATLTRPTASVDARDIAPIRRVMRESETRRWKHLAHERIEDPSPKIPLGKRFWPLAMLEREQLDGLFFGETAARFVHIFDGTEKDDVRLLDAAYWMKGSVRWDCSGMPRSWKSGPRRRRVSIAYWTSRKRRTRRRRVRIGATCQRTMRNGLWLARATFPLFWASG